MISKKIPVSGVNDANDVLETAEVVRASNIILRMSVGIIGFSNQICAAEVFSQDRIKSLDSSINDVFDALGTAYASLMGRYSALKSSEVGKDDTSSN